MVPDAFGQSAPISSLPTTSTAANGDNIIVNSTNTGLGTWTTHRTSLAQLLASPPFSIFPQLALPNIFTGATNYFDTGATNTGGLVSSLEMHVTGAYQTGTGTIPATTNGSFVIHDSGLNNKFAGWTAGYQIILNGVGQYYVTRVVDANTLWTSKPQGNLTSATWQYQPPSFSVIWRGNTVNEAFGLPLMWTGNDGSVSVSSGDHDGNSTGGVGGGFRLENWLDSWHWTTYNPGGKYGESMSFFHDTNGGVPAMVFSDLAPAFALGMVQDGTVITEVGISNDTGRVVISGGQLLNGGTTTAGITNNGGLTNNGPLFAESIYNVGPLTNAGNFVSSSTITATGNITTTGGAVGAGSTGSDIILEPIISGFGPNLTLSGENGSSGHGWNIIANTSSDGNAGDLTFRDASLGLNRGGWDTSGNFFVDTAGAGLQVKEGSNAKQGTVTMNGTSLVVVSTTAVAANSRIFLTCNVPGGTAGTEIVAARTAGTSFSVQSTSASDTSTVAWEMFAPAP